MNRGIFLFLGAVAALGLAGLYLLQHGSTLFVGHPTTDLIAFVSTRGGQSDIWTMKTDGTDKRQITNDAAEDTSPVWSPQGTEILSASNREGQRYEIFVSAWNGKYVKRLSTGAGTKDRPTWSADSKDLAFLSSGAVHVLPRFGDDDQQVLPTLEQGAAQSARPVLDAAWSRSGHALAAVQDTGAGQGVLVMEDFEHNPVPVTIAGTINIDWSKAGETLAVAFIDRKGANGILIADIANVEAHDILVTKGDTTGPGKLAWSPDGMQIAIEMWKIVDHRPDTCLGLYVVDTKGGKARLLAKGDAMDPTWSPDGKCIAYTLAREDGKRDIWRIGADGKGAVNLTNGEGDNFMPEWSPAPEQR